MKYYLSQTFIRQHLLRISIAVTAGVLHCICNLILLLSIGRYIELLFHSGGSKSRVLAWIGMPVPNDLNSFFILFLTAAIIKFILSWIEKYTTTETGMLYAAKARREYFQYLMYETETANVKPPARQLVWFSSELKSIQRYMELGMIGFAKDLIYFFICCYLLLQFHIVLGIVVACTIPLLWFVNKYSSHRLKQTTRKSRDAFAGLLSFVSKRLHELEQLQANNKTFRTTERFTARQQKALQLQKQLLMGKAVSSALVPTLLYLMLAALLFIIAWPNSITIAPADAVGFILLLLNLFGVIRRLVKVESIRMPGRLSLEKLEKAHTKLLHGPRNEPSQQIKPQIV